MLILDGENKGWMLEKSKLAWDFDNLCPQFAEGITRAKCWVYNLCPQFAERNSKRYSKKEDLLYGTIQLFFHYKTYNGGFFKNKKYVGNNKWIVCLTKGGRDGEYSLPPDKFPSHSTPDKGCFSILPNNPPHPPLIRGVRGV